MTQSESNNDFVKEELDEYAPIISVGMPVYNGEKYIVQAINSILAQTFVNFELIISDNASTDNTSDICQKFALDDERIKYIRQDCNMGPSWNFYYVLKSSKAKYFTWAASDDKWSANWLSALYEKIIESDKSAAFGVVIPIDSDSNFLPHMAKGRRYPYKGTRFFRKMKFYLDYEGGGKANIIYSLFSRKHLVDVNFENYRYDYTIIYDLLSDIDFVTSADCFFYKRAHQNSLGENQDEVVGYLKVWRFIAPLPLELFNDYSDYSSLKEKLFLIVLFPLKIFISYIERIRFFLSNYSLR